MLMLPVEETLLRRRGEASPEMVGDLYTISAPWSVLALAFSRKVSLWVSIGALPSRVQGRELALRGAEWLQHQGLEPSRVWAWGLSSLGTGLVFLAFLSLFISSSRDVADVI